MGNVVMKVENVQKILDGTEIIHHLSFEVQEGEIYGFLGPNGSGKTTTIRMMTGLISMTEGDITVCGYSIRTEREKALENIGAIVENPELYEYMTGWQNLKHFANMAL
ncbi:ATP-binding cassette domain-containing protein, partial [Bacillus thuringiensis]